MLGWEMSPDQLGVTAGRAETPIRNLYLLGHWTQPGGGITPVIVSAPAAVARTIANRRNPPHIGSLLWPCACLSPVQHRLSLNSELGRQLRRGC